MNKATNNKQKKQFQLGPFTEQVSELHDRIKRLMPESSGAYKATKLVLDSIEAQGTVAIQYAQEFQELKAAMHRPSAPMPEPTPDGTPRSFYGYLLAQCAGNAALVWTTRDDDDCITADVDKTVRLMSDVAEALVKHCKERSNER